MTYLTKTQVCTAMIGHGINGAKADDMLMQSVAQIIGNQHGYDKGGISNVVWFEVYGQTSGNRGHHNYTETLGCGAEFKRLVEQYGLGKVYFSRFNGATTGTGSEIRTVTWSVIGPVEVLNERAEQAFGIKYKNRVAHYVDRKTKWT